MDIRIVGIRVLSRELRPSEELGFGENPSTWGVPGRYSGRTNAKMVTQGVALRTCIVEAKLGRGASPRTLGIRGGMRGTRGAD